MNHEIIIKFDYEVVSVSTGIVDSPDGLHARAIITDDVLRGDPIRLERALDLEAKGILTDIGLFMRGKSSEEQGCFPETVERSQTWFEEFKNQMLTGFQGQ